LEQATYTWTQPYELGTFVTYYSNCTHKLVYSTRIITSAYATLRYTRLA